MQYNMIPLEKLNRMSEEQHEKICQRLGQKFEDCCKKYKLTQKMDKFVEDIQEELDKHKITLKFKLEWLEASSLEDLKKPKMYHQQFKEFEDNFGSKIKNILQESQLLSMMDNVIKDLEGLFIKYHILLDFQLLIVKAE